MKICHLYSLRHFLNDEFFVQVKNAEDLLRDLRFSLNTKEELGVSNDLSTVYDTLYHLSELLCVVNDLINLYVRKVDSGEISSEDEILSELVRESIEEQNYLHIISDAEVDDG